MLLSFSVISENSSTQNFLLKYHNVLTEEYVPVLLRYISRKMLIYTETI